MSTPTRKPLNPTDPFAAVQHETWKRAGPERQNSDAAGGKRVSTTPMSQERDDHSPMTAFEGTAAPRHLVDPDPAQSAHPNNRRPDQLAAARRDEILSDLERLEASVRRIQREQTAARLPRANQLPPVPGLSAVGEMFDNGYRSPRSLEPERLVSPAEMILRRDRLFSPLGILIASLFVAPAAYFLWVGGSVPRSAQGPQMASADRTPVVPPSISNKERPPIKAQDSDPGGLAQRSISAQSIKTSPTARMSEGESVAMLQPSGTGSEASPSNTAHSSKTIRALDPEEIRLLTKQGEQFAEVGDLVTARVLFLRAAEANDARAATALGATYDPAVIAQLGVVGIRADVEKARFWYQRAASLGSSDAKRRLELLATR
jgi:hypothetical protein